MYAALFHYLLEVKVNFIFIFPSLLQRELIFMFLDFLSAGVPARHSTVHAYTQSLVAHQHQPGGAFAAVHRAVAVFNMKNVDGATDPTASLREDLSAVWGAPADTTHKYEFLYLWDCLPGCQRGWVDCPPPPSMIPLIRFAVSVSGYL